MLFVWYYLFYYVYFYLPCLESLLGLPIGRVGSGKGGDVEKSPDHVTSRVSSLIGYLFDRWGFLFNMDVMS